MRMSLLIGLALIVVGFAALYQTRNGFLMSTIGGVYYSPPEESEALQAAFEDLGAKDAAENGYLLHQVAWARMICTLRQTGEQLTTVATEAFRISGEAANSCVVEGKKA